MKFLRRVINNWLNFALHRRVYSAVYSVLSECLWRDSGGIRTHDLLLKSIVWLTVLRNELLFPFLNGNTQQRHSAPVNW